MKIGPLAAPHLLFVSVFVFCLLSLSFGWSRRHPVKIGPLAAPHLPPEQSGEFERGWQPSRRPAYEQAFQDCKLAPQIRLTKKKIHLTIEKNTFTK